MKPRGNVRKLILYLNKIQDLVGRALGTSMNDRNPQQMDDLLKYLEKAHNLCIEARSLYEPIEDGD